MYTTATDSVINVRSWAPADTAAVWQVLKDGTFSNVNEAFKLCLQKSLVRVLSIALSIVLIGNGYSSLAIALWLLFGIWLIYGVCWLGTAIYLYGPNFADIENINSSYFSDPNHHFWVAECKGEIVGTIAIVRKKTNLPGSPDNTSEYSQDISKVAWLRRMAVKRTHRGKGIAKLLVEETKKFCKDKKFNSIFLITTEVHHAARKLYNCMGFELVARKPYKYFQGLVTVETYEFVLKL